MDWDRAIDKHREALQSIIAQLVALAALADCAAGRSERVRRLVLSILRPVELFARDMVICEAQASGAAMPDLPVSPHADDSIADAMRLASCFRALAVALAFLWAKALRPVPRCAQGSILLSNLSGSRPANGAHLFLHARRGLGFRALDSPHP